MLNENAIANAFAVTVPPVVAAPKFELPPLDVPTIDLGNGPIAATAPTPITDALQAKRDAKVESLVRKHQPKPGDKGYAEYCAPRVAKGLPIGTIARQVHGELRQLWRAAKSLPIDKAPKDPLVYADETNAVNSMVQHALDTWVIFETIGGSNLEGGSLKWLYSAAMYPVQAAEAKKRVEDKRKAPVTKAATLKAEAAELGW